MSVSVSNFLRFWNVNDDGKENSTRTYIVRADAARTIIIIIIIAPFAVSTGRRARIKGQKTAATLKTAIRENEKADVAVSSSVYAIIKHALPRPMHVPTRFSYVKYYTEVSCQ